MSASSFYRIFHSHNRQGDNAEKNMENEGLCVLASQNTDDCSLSHSRRPMERLLALSAELGRASITGLHATQLFRAAPENPDCLKKTQTLPLVSKWIPHPAMWERRVGFRLSTLSSLSREICLLACHWHIKHSIHFTIKHQQFNKTRS